MPRKKKTDGKAANGMGNIRPKTVTRDGKEYLYWEGRYTVGFDPGTGKQIQRSVTGKTQKEAAQKLKAALAALDAGTYTASCKMTVGSWMDIWNTDYLGGVKPYTVADYTANIKNHIKPALGAVKLEALNTHTIQGFYNKLVKPPEEGGKGLSPKTLRNIHSVLHRALQQAVSIGYIHSNPTDACILPRMEKKEIKPLDETQTKAFLAAIKGHPLETLFTVTLFTGLRKGEALGLRWDCVDFKRGTILIDKQLQREKKKGSAYVFVPLKNDKSRTITPAPWVMQLLKHHRAVQAEQRLKLGPMWEDSGLVFTTETGQHLDIHTIQRAFKPIVASIGCPEVRFHDLRHSYAVAAIRSGDDIKTVQGNLGHGHRRLYPGRVRARHRPNEAGERPPHGELYQGRFRPVRENIREKTQKKTRYPLRDNGFHWSCYPDLNWRPHPYQQPRKIFCNLFCLFIVISAPSQFLSSTF